MGTLWDCQDGRPSRKQGRAAGQGGEERVWGSASRDAPTGLRRIFGRRERGRGVERPEPPCMIGRPSAVEVPLTPRALFCVVCVAFVLRLHRFSARLYSKISAEWVRQHRLVPMPSPLPGSCHSRVCSARNAKECKNEAKTLNDTTIRSVALMDPFQSTLGTFPRCCLDES